MILDRDSSIEMAYLLVRIKLLSEGQAETHVVLADVCKDINHF
jgi:hypothetical protein